jgi:hypothetical protein
MRHFGIEVAHLCAAGKSKLSYAYLWRAPVDWLAARTRDLLLGLI